MQALRQQAMQEFYNFGGPGEDKGFVAPVVENQPIYNPYQAPYHNPYQYGHHYPQHQPYYNMTGAEVAAQKGNQQVALPEISSNDRFLTMEITNNSGTETKTANIFGAFRHIGESNLGNDPDITINITESSYRTVINESQSNPFVVSQLRMKVNDAGQINRGMRINEETPSGKVITTPIQIANRINPTYENQNIVDLNGIQWQIDGRTWIEYEMLPGQSVTLIFTIQTRGNIANILTGKPVLEAATSKYMGA